MLAIAAEILSRLGLQQSYCITINSVEIFNGIAANLDLDDASREQMRQLIDTRESAELQRFLTSYKTSAEERSLFARLTQLTGKREMLNEARLVITNPRSVAALNALAALWSVIESVGLQNTFEIDLGDVSSLDYYTGLSFKVFVRGAGFRVGRGGRYDRLTANFGRSEPAVGFVLDLDALTEVVGRGEFSLARNNGREVSVISRENVSETFAAAQLKRANNERVRIEFG
jgi:ATP phosphoribosyltransferase regulatory subunit